MPDDQHSSVQSLLNKVEALMVTSQQSGGINFLGCLLEALGIIEALDETGFLTAEAAMVYYDRIVGLRMLYDMNFVANKA